MKFTTLVVAMLLICSAVACRSRNRGEAGESSAAVSASMSQTVNDIRTRFQRVNPGVQVAAVVSVNAASRTATIGDVQSQFFRTGDIVTFIDSGTDPLANGRVTEVRSGELTVQYETPAVGKRAPRAGDLIVKL